MTVGGLEHRNAKALYHFAKDGAIPELGGYVKGLGGEWAMPANAGGSWNHKVGSLALDYIRTRGVDAEARLYAHVSRQNDGITWHGGGEQWSSGYGEHPICHLAIAGVVSTSDRLTEAVAVWLRHELWLMSICTAGPHPALGGGTPQVLVPGLRCLSRRSGERQVGMSACYGVLVGNSVRMLPPRKDREPSSDQYLVWALQAYQSRVRRLLLDGAPPESEWYVGLTSRVPVNVWWTGRHWAAWIERNGNGNNPPVWATSSVGPRGQALTMRKKGAGRVEARGRQIVATSSGRSEAIDLPAELVNSTRASHARIDQRGFRWILSPGGHVPQPPREPGPPRPPIPPDPGSSLLDPITAAGRIRREAERLEDAAQRNEGPRWSKVRGVAGRLRGVADGLDGGV